MLGFNDLVILSCSIFKDVITMLSESGELKGRVIFYDSNLHMKPDKLKTVLDNLIGEELKLKKKVLLVSGDCHPDMHCYSDHPNITRPDGVNCCDLLMSAEYKKIRKTEGAFILIREWTIRWKEFFQGYLALDEKTARSFMGDMHKKFYYLDLGINPVPESELEEIKTFFNLPVEILKIDVTSFREKLRKSLMKFEGTDGK